MLSNFVVYIPENDVGIVEGYYSLGEIVACLREYADEPEKIRFIADMLEQ